jgi:molybdopterin converting factor small subunit
LKITARLHTTLRRPTPTGLQNRVTVELAEGAAITSLLQLLDIATPTEELMFLIGPRRVEPNYILHDGDEVNLFPPISGGC